MLSTSSLSAEAVSFFHISWQSMDDGPGKRLVLFLQGCSLNCLWCHSPHSTPRESPLLYFAELCTGCTACSRACNRGVHLFADEEHLVNRDSCIKCGACVAACPSSSSIRNTGALALPTRTATVTTLFDKISPQLELLKNKGGITFSGGEPLLQPDAVAALARRCKEMGVNTAVETSGIIPLDNIKRVINNIDIWLIGMRLTTGHQPGVSPELTDKIRETIGWIKQNSSATIILRIPVIPTFTSTPEYLGTALEIIQDFSLTNIDILPENPEEGHYYRASGLPSPIAYDKRLAQDAFKQVSDFFQNHKLN